jgi:hypothetical protein
VVITHTPPYAHRDIRLGCPALLQAIYHVRPRLHVCGHVHSGHGKEALFFDDSQRAYETLVSNSAGIVGDLNPKRWREAVSVVWHGVRGLLWHVLMEGRKGANGAWLVNAAMTYQSTGRIGNPPSVVIL